MAGEQDSGHRVLVILTTLTCLASQIPDTLGQCQAKGTTPRLRELVLGKCIDYKSRINPGPFCNTNVNCTDLAELFVSSFANQPTCNISFSRYDNFIKAAHIDVSRDKRSTEQCEPNWLGFKDNSLFWSGAGDVAQRYSNGGQNLMTLENTLIGHMADTLIFCGQENPPGLIVDQECDTYSSTVNCTYPAMFSFWVVASQNFAALASGEATVMLNGSREEAFRNFSFFGSREVPNLNSTRVTKLRILLVHIPGHEIKSTCDSDNIGELKRLLREKNIPFVCEDSPRGPQTLLCVDYPNEKECQRETTTAASAGQGTDFLSIFLAVQIVLKCIVF